MKYTINGKDYSMHDINVACAEIIGVPVVLRKARISDDHLLHKNQGLKRYSPCTNPLDAWPIIDKVLDELLKLVNKHGDEPKTKNGIFWTRWQHLQELHNCTKLVAACICFIEVNS